MGQAIANAIFSLIFSFFSGIIGFVIDLIGGTIGVVVFPGYLQFAQYVEGFWDLCFQFVGFIRSMFLIDSFTMSLLFIALTIKLTYKPTIALIKMFFHWFDKLKL